MLSLDVVLSVRKIGPYFHKRAEQEPEVKPNLLCRPHGVVRLCRTSIECVFRSFERMS